MNFTYNQLDAMKTLEVDSREVHMFPWYLKVWAGDHRIWIQKETKLISREIWRDGDYHPAE